MQDDLRADDALIFKTEGKTLTMQAIGQKTGNSQSEGSCDVFDRETTRISQPSLLAKKYKLIQLDL